MEVETSYLHSTLGTTLTDALSQYIASNQINLQHHARDPITYISAYLRNYVSMQDSRVELLQRTASLHAADTALHTAIQQKHTRAAELAAQHRVEVDTKSGALDDVFRADRTYATYSDLLAAFLPAIQSATHSTGVTVAKVINIDENKQLRYIAADPSSQYMLDQKLDGSEGITWQLYDRTVEESSQDSTVEENETLTEEQIAAKRDILPLNQLFVPNVATYADSARIRYFHPDNPAQLALGAYCAVQLTVNELCHNAVLDDSIVREAELIDTLKERDEQAAADAREAEEQARVEAEAERAQQDTEQDSDGDNNDDDATQSSAAVADVVPAEPTEADLAAQKQRETNYIVSELQRVPTDYIVCFDTLRQNRKYTADELQYIQKYCKQLRAAMHTIDLNVFLAERENRRAVLAYLDTYEPLEEDARAEQAEKIGDKLSKQQPDACSEADIAYTQQKQYMMTKHIWNELQCYAGHTLVRGDLNVLYALLTLYNYKTSELCNAFGEAVWDKVRVHLTSALQSQFDVYNPRQINEQYGSLSSEIQRINQIVETIDVDALRDSNMVMYETWQYVDSVIKVKQQLRQELIEERARQREEAEAQRIAEEEAAEAARVEEEERLSAEAEAEGEDGEADVEETE